MVMPDKWTLTENRKYLLFLRENRQKFENFDLRRCYKIYKRHHLRMVEAYKSIDEIIEKLQKLKEDENILISYSSNQVQSIYFF
jgi:hypothetical protein